jgi:ketosteroid isomerase-like protein
MMPNVAIDVIDAEARRCAAMLANDRELLDTLMDPRLMFHHATGAVDDKAAYLAKVTAGRIAYLSIEWSEQSVVGLGQVALLTGRMISLVRVDGREKQLDNRVLAVWTYDGSWRLLAFQSTPLVR